MESDASGIPNSVRDAVLARAARLSPSSRAVLSACALIGARVEAWLLEKITQAELESVEACLDSGMLLSTESGYMFRHELTRQAILDSTSAQRRTAVHRLILDELRNTKHQDAARLAHHAEEAGDAEAVLEYAVKAAEEASKLNSHREAVSQYERALRVASETEAAKRAQLFEDYAQECMATGQPQKAIEAYQHAIKVWQRLNKPLKEGMNLARLAHAYIHAGQNANGEQMSRAAIDLLETLPASAELAYALYVQTNLRMFDRDGAEAVQWGKKALALAQEVDDKQVIRGVTSTIGWALVIVHNDIAKGQDYLMRGLELAVDAKDDTAIHACYSNFGSGNGEYYQFAEAEDYLKRAIDFGREGDLNVSYSLSWLALTQMYLGRWQDATATAQTVFKEQNQAISRIMARVALGRVRARRGDPDVWDVLDDTLEQGFRLGNLATLGACLCGSSRSRVARWGCKHGKTRSLQHP